MIHNLVGKTTHSLMQILDIINKNAKGIAFIVDENNIFKGLITDGDIRRHLLSHGDLGVEAKTIINENFVFAKDTENKSELIKKINEQIKIIPILDKENKLVDYFEYKTDVYIPVAIPDLNGNEFKYLMDAFISTWISSSGEYIKRFEDSFSNYCNMKHGIAVSNGTVAIHLALKALGIGEGDEVIVPDFTFAAPVNAIIHANAKPVIVDIDRESWCISPKEIEKVINKRTKAILPVHIYGQPCNMDAITAIAKKNSLFIIEDCAEAHGAMYDGKKVGSFGDISCFSFFANKVITTGEGGMCLTNNDELNDKMRTLRDHGMSRSKKYWHEVVGFNYRMTNLQAAIGVAQLERINSILDFRRNIEDKYQDKLRSIPGISFQHDLEQSNRITWLVCAIMNNRDTVLDALKECKIDVRPFFYSLGTMDIYKEYLVSNSVSKEISAKGISFPTNNLISDIELNTIYEIVVKHV